MQWIIHNRVVFYVYITNLLSVIYNSICEQRYKQKKSEILYFKCIDKNFVRRKAL